MIQCIISGCLTFDLTLVRTIVINNPFYRIKQRLFVSGLVILVVVLITLMQVLVFWKDVLLRNVQVFNVCGLIIAILSCCNILMSAATIIVLKKTRGDGRQERNHAVVTMVIISGIKYITRIASIPVLITILILHNDYLHLESCLIFIRTIARKRLVLFH